MREKPKEASSRSVLQLAVETTLHFPIPRLAVGVGLSTHSQQIRRLGLGRLTCPGDRQQVGDGFCRIFSGGGETSPNF